MQFIEHCIEREEHMFVGVLIVYPPDHTLTGSCESLPPPSITRKNAMVHD